MDSGFKDYTTATIPPASNYVRIDTFDTTPCNIEIRKAENGYIAKQDGDEYVFKTTKQLFTWLEKEMDGS